MTTIIKAAQDALEAMERYQVKRQDFERFADEIDALRAALQDKAGEVQTVAIDHLRNEQRDGTTGHIWPPVTIGTKLFSAKPAPAVPDGFALVPVEPEFSSIARRKLGGLQGSGWQINGYAIRRGNERGFIDSSGFVGWWRSDMQTPVVSEDVARDSAWFRIIRDSSGWPAVFAAHDAPEPLRGDDLDAAMLAASQQKGGQHG